MQPLTAEAFVRVMDAYAQVLAEFRDVLNELDNRIGDGDHGTNMARGFSAVAEKLKASQPTTPAAGCQTVAMTLLGTVGGASGPLYSTAFLKLSAAWNGRADVDEEALRGGVAAALEGIMARGRAAVGDKTMVDVWTAVQRELQTEQPLDAQRAVEAAAAAALATKPLTARKGRAAYLGDRSQGTVDPGSLSSALWFAELFAAMSEGVVKPQWDLSAL
ncbi:dihydroxyacetone kinase subunit L [Alicyclobacillus contaminans]|uniref:dihydroxyacetone kinase subunit DhaL n=1 Tax=Alicyclobacillus contaminans TaxID=392016 RepID=UPI000428293A|nr:dihydroxyacetone kinase subunit DhaL [Alicyclobacillus contaminans]GMA51443.1 dihydroxyacetone kinase subunit L [Alicyclobacillus contaminans]